MVQRTPDRRASTAADGGTQLRPNLDSTDVLPDHGRKTRAVTPDAEPLVYTRQLPGGGYVAIEATRHDKEYRLSLFVERRVDPKRRSGHAPPVIAESTEAEPLIRIAENNVEVARALRRWQAQRAD